MSSEFATSLMTKESHEVEQRRCCQFFFAILKPSPVVGGYIKIGQQHLPTLVGTNGFVGKLHSVSHFISGRYFYFSVWRYRGSRNNKNGKVKKRADDLGELGSVKSFWLLRELSPATNLKIYDKLGFLSIENLLKRFITKKLKNILFQRVPPPFPLPVPIIFQCSQNLW